MLSNLDQCYFVKSNRVCALAPNASLRDADSPVQVSSPAKEGSIFAIDVTQGALSSPLECKARNNVTSGARRGKKEKSRSSPSNLSQPLKKVDGIKRSTCLASVYCSGSSGDCSLESSTVESAAGDGSGSAGASEIDHRRLSEGCIKCPTVNEAHESDTSDTGHKVHQDNGRSKWTRDKQVHQSTSTGGYKTNTIHIDVAERQSGHPVHSTRATCSSEPAACRVASSVSSPHCITSINSIESCGNSSLLSIHSDFVDSEILSVGEMGDATATTATTATTGMTGRAARSGSGCRVTHPPADALGDSSNNTSKKRPGERSANKCVANTLVAGVCISVPDCRIGEEEVRPKKEAPEEAESDGEGEMVAREPGAGADEEAIGHLASKAVTQDKNGKVITNGSGSRKLSQLQKIARKIRVARAWIRKDDKSNEQDGDLFRSDTFLERFNLTSVQPDDECEVKKKSFCFGRLSGSFVIDPSATFYYYWLCLISTAILYNLLVIIARAVFWELNNRAVHWWTLFDYASDLLYACDMLVQSRTGYLEQGLLVRQSNKLLVNYFRSWTLTFDLVSLIPTDLFYFITGLSCSATSIPCPVILRSNRLFKVYRLSECFDRTETRTNFPNTFRILKLVLIIIIVIHWNGCLYFAASYAIGFGTDRWVFNITAHPQLSYQYIYCIYWSTMTLTAIGEAADPVKTEEYLFVVLDFLMGILIFATIVGNVGAMISNMNASRVEFQQRMDAVKQYMELRRVSKDLETRVVKWFDYLWSNKQSLNEDAVTAVLPEKLKAEIAIQVHLDTLKKVKLFQDCESGLLAELVLRLRLQIFSPGDYVCRKGDVGKEMYIVKRGKLSVVGDDGKKVFATLADGAVFGELSVLNITGNKTGNRRTANVRSVGYSDLFVLSKTDLWDVLQDYPDAKEMLVERGKTILRKDNLLDEEVLARSQREQETLIARSVKLTEGLESLNENFSHLLQEFILTQRKLKTRVTRLENAIHGLSPWTSSLTLAQSGLDAVSPGHSQDIPFVGRSISLRVRPPSSVANDASIDRVFDSCEGKRGADE